MLKWNNIILILLNNGTLKKPVGFFQTILYPIPFFYLLIPHTVSGKINGDNIWFSGDKNSVSGFPTLAVVGLAIPGGFIVAGSAYLVWNKWIKKLRSVDSIV